MAGMPNTLAALMQHLPEAMPGATPPFIPVSSQPKNFLSRLLESIPNALQTGIDAAATPNIAGGGWMDVFRGISNAGQLAQDRADRRFSRDLATINLRRQQKQDALDWAKYQRQVKVDDRNAEQFNQRENRYIQEAANQNALKMYEMGVGGPQTLKFGDGTAITLDPAQRNKQLEQEALQKLAMDVAKQSDTILLDKPQTVLPTVNPSSQFGERMGGARLPQPAQQTQVPDGYRVLQGLELMGRPMARPTPEYEANLKRNTAASVKDIPLNGTMHRVALGQDGQVAVDFGEIPQEGSGKTQAERYVDEYLSSRNLPRTIDNINSALRARAAANQSPQRPPQQLLIVPGSEGPVAQVFRGGEQVPDGAVTAAGMSSLNVPTAATRSMVETAPTITGFADRLSGPNGLIQQARAKLGPAAGRWNEFMVGEVGLSDPLFSQIRTDLGLLETALMRMHVGARGGEQMMEHFHNLIGAAKQSPDNMLAAISEIKLYADRIIEEGRVKRGNFGGGATPSNENTLPGGITLEDIAAEKKRRQQAGGQR